MNRKQILSGSVVAAFAALLLAWAPTEAFAGTEPESPAAIVVMGQGCSFGALLGGPAFTTDPSKNVLNKNRVKLTCVFEDVFNDSGAAKHFKNFLCGINIPGVGVFLTENSRIVIAYDETDNLDSAVLQCWLKLPGA